MSFTSRVCSWALHVKPKQRGFVLTHAHLQSKKKCWRGGFSDISIQRNIAKVKWKHFFCNYASSVVTYGVMSRPCIMFGKRKRLEFFKITYDQRGKCMTLHGSKHKQKRANIILINFTGQEFMKIIACALQTVFKSCIQKLWCTNCFTFISCL